MDPNTPITCEYADLCRRVHSATLVIDLFFAIMTAYFIKSERSAGVSSKAFLIPMITPSVVYSVLWVWLLEAPLRMASSIRL